MSKPRAFAQVDVFTSIPMMGNPVAVVLDGEGLSDAQMQSFANWTNLSETTFVTPSPDDEADYNIRIFTPSSELPFAGHPTLGTAHILLETGRMVLTNATIRQRSAVGVVAIGVAGDSLSFRLPKASISDAPDVASLADALPGITFASPPKVVNVGPHWVVGECASADALAALSQDVVKLAVYDHAHGVTGQTLYAVNSDGSILVRSFAAGDGISEDPVCGSGNGAVAAYRLAQGQVERNQSYRASQGTQVGRDGTVHISIDDAGDIHVGGSCLTLINGTVSI